MKSNRMRFALVKALPCILLALSLAHLSGCQGMRQGGQPKPLAKCMEEVNAVPEIAAALKARGQEGEANGSRPLEGMELALTINGMLKSYADPEENPDDWCYTENNLENLGKLIHALKENSLPPTVSFIVGQDADRRVQELWLQSGNLVGSMTFGRPRVKRKSAQVYIEDLERNDRLLAPLWAKYPHKQKYFRFPRLNTGGDEQKRAAIREYLNGKGYVEVPASIYSPDDKLTQLYCSALARGDQACANYLRASLKTLLLDSTLRARNLAVKATGKEARHVLIVGANQLMCDNLAELLVWYKSLGARFISLDEALADPLYSKNTRTGDSAAARIYKRSRQGPRAETGG